MPAARTARTTRTVAKITAELRASYLAQYSDDSAIDIYVETWERAVDALGREEAVAIFWEIMASLPRAKQSDCDPDGNDRAEVQS